VLPAFRHTLSERATVCELDSKNVPPYCLVLARGIVDRPVGRGLAKPQRESFLELGLRGKVPAPKLSEYHTGFRAFSRQVLETLPLKKNSDDFVFDNKMLAQSIYFGFKIGEISCPTKYFADASSINFSGSVKYGVGVLATALRYRLAKSGIKRNW
jgi:hypothetical protein